MLKKIPFFVLLFLPILLFGQLSEKYKEMKKDKDAKIENYEGLLYEASGYIFDNPINTKSKEFMSATKIVSFWMNKDMGINIPTFGKFYNALTNKNQQQFLYMVAMINYAFDQKINHERILSCKKLEGQNYNEQKDVREIQLEGAKILLDFIGNKKNNVPINRKTKKYLKIHRKGELANSFFEK
jgi:hypothetical protein